MGSLAPSIFNDVLGPVMRGPSSSHVAGAARIGSLLLQAAGAGLAKVQVDFDVNGSLAESHTGHGTDMGFACGILGIPLTDPRVDRYEELIANSGIELEYRILDYGAEHPNHYRIAARSGAGKELRMDAVSTGGGMIEVISLDGLPVSMEGDFFECCMIFPESACPAPEELEGAVPDLERVIITGSEGKRMAECKCSSPLLEEARERLKDRFSPEEMFVFRPVLPTQSTFVREVPFRTAEGLLKYNKGRGRELWQLALEYESIRGGATEEAVREQMRGILRVMRGAVENGLAGTSYGDRILPSQSHLVGEAASRRNLVPGEVMNTVIADIAAVMESKSSMGVIVAAPTCGSCGCLPGTVIGLADAMGLSEEDAVRGLLAAGLIGVFFAEQATFAAEVGGCQMECGAGSGMAAAAVAQMCGGTAAECLDAASMALQGLTGLACDPVANRVEVPCLNKNVAAGMNALASANMILAGFDKVIPLDETIGAMYEIGLSLPLELRCTFGGLGKTKTSLAIRRRLEETAR